MATDQMIGASPIFLAAVERIERFARSSSPVLITGATGSGKEVLARHLHEQSGRCGQFIAVNCSALQDTLIEAELMGHVRGAFTDALQAREGKFRAANKGTLFLDEVSECTPRMQAKLLRVIQEREVSPLGSDKSLPIDVRIVAATNKSLPILVTERTFREDLYYRLAVLTVHLPPLRERPEDIPLFLAAFLKEFGYIESIDPEATRQLCAYEWPGNVREMRNMIEQCAILADTPILRAEDLPFTLQPGEGPESFGLRLPDGGFCLPKTMEVIAKRFILQALSRSGGNQSKAARLLGMKRTSLIAMMHRYGLFTVSELSQAAASNAA